jgi:phosphate transport system substrate-binding protein
MRTITAWVSLLALAATGTACSKKQAEGGSVSIDGSSTVFLISAATAERAKKEIGVDATVGSSGTGGGFKKFCAGEIDIAGASRPIKAAEADACKAKNIEWIELPVAYDGIAVVVSTKNAFVDKLTVDELKKMWAPEAEGQVSKWSQIRDGLARSAAAPARRRRRLRHLRLLHRGDRRQGARQPRRLPPVRG